MYVAITKTIQIFYYFSFCIPWYSTLLCGFYLYRCSLSLNKGAGGGCGFPPHHNWIKIGLFIIAACTAPVSMGNCFLKDIYFLSYIPIYSSDSCCVAASLPPGEGWEGLLPTPGKAL